MNAKSVVEKLQSEIRAFAEAHADPARVARYARYFKEGYDAWGIDHEDPAWKRKQEDWFNQLKPLKAKGFLEFGDRLVSSPKYEESALPIVFLARVPELYNLAVFDHLDRWFQAGIRNWAHCDVLCGEVLARFLQAGVVGPDAFSGWRESPHKYQRRAVPVSFLALLKTSKDVRPLLAFLRPMMMDPERVVHQGLGWFLREAWKKHPEPVEAFLTEWKDKAPRLIFQYATEKMTLQARNRFRKAKVGAAGS